MYRIRFEPVGGHWIIEVQEEWLYRWSKVMDKIANEPKARNVAVIGTAMAGDRGTAMAGEGGTATAGYHGTATAGDHGTAMAGDYGTAMAGYHGTATAGNCGTAIAGYHGTATAGDHGEIHIQWWDSKAQRCRTKIGYVGEDGIKPYTAYHLNASCEFEEAQP